MLTTETVIFRLGIALLAGAIIGLEREYRDKSAGFRTIILICLGSSLFTIVSLLLVSDTMDRILANIVTGIGFIGGGVIFKSEEGINGLTTAATIWVTAAVGMAVGAGYYYAAGSAIAATFFVLSILYHVENLIARVNKERTYTITAALSANILEEYEKKIVTHHLKYKEEKKAKHGKEIMGTYKIRGSKKNHQQFIDYMLRDEKVIKFDF
jgi:putative Mg2+ transporter-C (MgtC) family protein